MSPAKPPKTSPTTVPNCGYTLASNAARANPIPNLSNRKVGSHEYTRNSPNVATETTIVMIRNDGIRNSPAKLEKVAPSPAVTP